jgi:hypothetical protein
MTSVYIADSAISEAVFNLNNNGTGVLGSKASPKSFSGGTYYTVSTTNSDGSFTITGTATYGGSTRALASVAYKAPTTSSPFTGGVFSKQNFVCSSNSFIDSFKSSLGSYASQAVNTYKSKKYALTNGGIASNGSISLDSNSCMFGPVTPGPAKALTTSANVYVTGSTASATAARTLTAITVPSTGLTTTVVGSIGTGVTKVVGPGSLSVSTITVDGTLVLKGPLTVVVNSLSAHSNSHVYIDTTNGPVTYYGTGTFAIDSNVDVIHVNPKTGGGYTQQTAPKPSNFAVNLTMCSAKLTSNNTFYGTLYAPNGTVNLDSNGGFFGAMVADKIIMDSNFGIHYDEDLNSSGSASASKWVIASWRETVPQ